MPERFPTNKPLVLAGTPLMSGTPNTGQLSYTLGGSKTFTAYSGTAGGDANIWVGGGRLDRGFVHNALASLVLSGKPIVLYDSAVAVSGGPLATSGHNVVGILSVGSLAGVNTLSGVQVIGGAIQDLGGMVFTSGLCYTGTSGQPGFTVGYTPVVSG